MYTTATTACVMGYLLHHVRLSFSKPTTPLTARHPPSGHMGRAFTAVDVIACMSFLPECKQSIARLLLPAHVCSMLLAVCVLPGAHDTCLFCVPSQGWLRDMSPSRGS